LGELPVVSGGEVVRALLRAGFSARRHTGGHRILVHAVSGLTVPIPMHGGKDLKSGTLRHIIRQAGLTVDEFLALL
jgi:predicted RNA binding protein YcfA (HicA-like mRNA interferase family)